jgi:hypothetical protein
MLRSILKRSKTTERFKKILKLGKPLNIIVVVIMVVVFCVGDGYSIQEPCNDKNFPIRIKLNGYEGRIIEMNNYWDTIIFSNERILISQLEKCGRRLIINEFDVKMRKLLHQEYAIEHDTTETIKVIKDPTDVDPVPVLINSKYFILKEVGVWYYFDSIGNIIRKEEY